MQKEDRLYVLCILLLFLFSMLVYLYWPHESFYEGIDNSTTPNKYDEMYNKLIASLPKLPGFFNNDPKFKEQINANLTSELPKLLASNSFSQFSYNNGDFGPINDVISNISNDNRTKLSQLLTTVIQFLTDFNTALGNV